jgi:hypothetical protein
MADDGPSNHKGDARFEHIKDRIASGFPKLAGAKLDKLLLTDEIRFAISTILVFSKLISDHLSSFSIKQRNCHPFL